MKAPTLWNIIKELTVSMRQRSLMKKNEKESSQICNEKMAMRSTISAMILKCRCPDMTAHAYRTGLILRFYGTGTMV